MAIISQYDILSSLGDQALNNSSAASVYANQQKTTSSALKSSVLGVDDTKTTAKSTSTTLMESTLLKFSDKISFLNDKMDDRFRQQTEQIERFKTMVGSKLDLIHKQLVIMTKAYAQVNKAQLELIAADERQSRKEFNQSRLMEAFSTKLTNFTNKMKTMNMRAGSPEAMQFAITSIMAQTPGLKNLSGVKAATTKQNYKPGAFTFKMQKAIEDFPMQFSKFGKAFIKAHDSNKDIFNKQLTELRGIRVILAKTLLEVKAFHTDTHKVLSEVDNYLNYISDRTNRIDNIVLEIMRSNTQHPITQQQNSLYNKRNLREFNIRRNKTDVKQEDVMGQLKNPKNDNAIREMKDTNRILRSLVDIGKENNRYMMSLGEAITTLGMGLLKNPLLRKLATGLALASVYGKVAPMVKNTIAEHGGVAGAAKDAFNATTKAVRIVFLSVFGSKEERKQSRDKIRNVIEKGFAVVKKALYDAAVKVTASILQVVWLIRTVQRRTQDNALINRPKNSDGSEMNAWEAFQENKRRARARRESRMERMRSGVSNTVDNDRGEALSFLKELKESREKQQQLASGQLQLGPGQDLSNFIMTHANKESQYAAQKTSILDKLGLSRNASEAEIEQRLANPTIRDRFATGYNKAKSSATTGPGIIRGAWNKFTNTKVGRTVADAGQVVASPFALAARGVGNVMSVIPGFEDFGTGVADASSHVTSGVGGALGRLGTGAGNLANRVTGNRFAGAGRSIAGRVSSVAGRAMGVGGRVLGGLGSFASGAAGMVSSLLGPTMLIPLIVQGINLIKDNVWPMLKEKFGLKGEGSLGIADQIGKMIPRLAGFALSVVRTVFSNIAKGAAFMIKNGPAILKGLVKGVFNIFIALIRDLAGVVAGALKDTFVPKFITNRLKAFSENRSSEKEYFGAYDNFKNQKEKEDSENLAAIAENTNPENGNSFAGIVKAFEDFKNMDIKKIFGSIGDFFKSMKGMNFKDLTGKFSDTLSGFVTSMMGEGSLSADILDSAIEKAQKSGSSAALGILQSMRKSLGAAGILTSGAGIIYKAAQLYDTSTKRYAEDIPNAIIESLKADRENAVDIIEDKYSDSDLKEKMGKIKTDSGMDFFTQAFLYGDQSKFKDDPAYMQYYHAYDSSKKDTIQERMKDVHQKEITIDFDDNGSVVSAGLGGPNSGSTQQYPIIPASAPSPANTSGTYIDANTGDPGEPTDMLGAAVNQMKQIGGFRGKSQQAIEQAAKTMIALNAEGAVNKHLVPSRILAQAMLESGWFETYRAKHYNNPFGIKYAPAFKETIGKDDSGFSKFDSVPGGVHVRLGLKRFKDLNERDFASTRDWAQEHVNKGYTTTDKSTYATNVSNIEKGILKAIGGYNSFSSGAASAATSEALQAAAAGGVTGSSGTLTGFDSILPPKTWRLSSKFSAARKSPVDGVVRPHNGVDLAAPIGTPIAAPLAGKVSLNPSRSSSAGNWVKIDNGNGVTTSYMHMNNKSPLQVGTMVKAGDIIGQVGNTGRSTGPHLHFEYRLNNKPIDPLSIIKGFSVDGTNADVFNAAGGNSGSSNNQSAYGATGPNADPLATTNTTASTGNNVLDSLQSSAAMSFISQVFGAGDPGPTQGILRTDKKWGNVSSFMNSLKSANRNDLESMIVSNMGVTGAITNINAGKNPDSERPIIIVAPNSTNINSSNPYVQAQSGNGGGDPKHSSLKRDIPFNSYSFQDGLF